MNEVISKVLKTGLYLSLAVTALGLILVAVRPPAATDLRALPIPELARDLAHGSGVAVLDLGLVLLMLTPVARVVAALVTFAMQGHRRFTWISVGVLAVLTASFLAALFTGAAGG